jgi:hypothetical protein
VFVRGVLGAVTAVLPAELQCVLETVDLSAAHRLDSAVYWKAAPRGPYDTGYDPHHPKVRGVAAALRARGVEMGIHPSYDTFMSLERLASEVDVVRQLCGEALLGGRQHYLRWHPDTWVHWERSGLAYDSSVGYPERVGFRAGTCTPYRPWCFSRNEELALLEIPLIVMDGTLTGYMNLEPQEGLKVVRALVRRCRTVGGVFTLLWHNDNNLLYPAYANVYMTLLRELSGSARFDWHARLMAPN